MAPRKAALNGFGRIGEPPHTSASASTAPQNHCRRPHLPTPPPLHCALPPPPPPPLPAGRLAFRLAFDSAEVQIVHVNEPTVIESSAYLLKYDSVHGA